MASTGKAAGMLVLTRRAGQVVKIGDGIEVVVVSVRGEQVRIGICAPREVSVVRGELLEQVSEENRAAAHASRLIGELAGGKGAPALKPRGGAADDMGSRAGPGRVRSLSASSATGLP